MSEPQSDLAVLAVQLKQLGESGQHQVDVSKLIDWIESYEKASPAEKYREFELEHYKAILENNRLSFRAEHETALEMFNSVINAGQSALRAAMVLSGGACVAMLAFLGNIWSKPFDRAAVAGLSDALEIFTYSVLSAVIAFGITYLTQYIYAKKWDRAGHIFNAVAIAIVLSSYSLFAYGAHLASSAIRTQLETPHNQPMQTDEP